MFIGLLLLQLIVGFIVSLFNYLSSKNYQTAIDFAKKGENYSWRKHERYSMIGVIGLFLFIFITGIIVGLCIVFGTFKGYFSVGFCIIALIYLFYQAFRRG